MKLVGFFFFFVKKEGDEIRLFKKKQIWDFEQFDFFQHRIAGATSFPAICQHSRYFIFLYVQSFSIYLFFFFCLRSCSSVNPSTPPFVPPLSFEHYALVQLFFLCPQISFSLLFSFSRSKSFYLVFRSLSFALSIFFLSGFPPGGILRRNFNFEFRSGSCNQNSDQSVRGEMYIVFLIFLPKYF